MQIQALGYIGVAAQGLDDWAHFGTRFLGMQQVDRTQKRMALRMDDRKQRVIIEDHGHNGLGYLGWETADQAALDALAARLAEHKVAVETGTRALCEERKVKASSASGTRSRIRSKPSGGLRRQRKHSSPAARSRAFAQARSAWDMPCFRSRASMPLCRSIAMCWGFTRATTCNRRSRHIFFMSTRASTVSRCWN